MVLYAHRRVADLWLISGIYPATPLALPPGNRDKLVQLLLYDIRESLTGEKGRLSRKGMFLLLTTVSLLICSCLDLGLALLALKTLGRANKASEIISASEVRAGCEWTHTRAHRQPAEFSDPS